MKNGMLVVLVAASLAAGVVFADDIGGLARAAGTAMMEGCRDMMGGGMMGGGMMGGGMMGGGMMGGEGRGRAPNDQWRGMPGR